MNDEKILLEVYERFQRCLDFEAYWRANYELDIKFANADSINNYQWLDSIRNDRIANPAGAKPCLTVNKTRVHNNLIINDAKQNKASINIRPIGDGATYQASQVFNDLIRHIEYRSNAQTVYDASITTQVDGGMGYWRVTYDYESPDSFNKELKIEGIKDPRAVYLDPDITQTDGSDARYGFIYEDVPTDLFQALYPKFKDVGGPALMGDYSRDWLTENHTRVCEYFRKSQEDDKLVAFDDPETGERVTSRWSNLTDEGKDYCRQLKQQKANSYQERDILTDVIEWFKIAGNKIIERNPWPGIYIPIVRNPGTETIIDGRMDRAGNTRGLLDPQRMYNYNASCYVEMVALQPRSPFVGPVAAIEGLEEYWKTANSNNHSMLPYNHVDEAGEAIPAPERSAPPALVPAYIQGMETAEKQMMMATGQYQAQMGENENAKSGVAINARQRQGDRATYHFTDNQAMAIRYTGKILVDLIPKVMDTERTLRIMGLDGSHTDVTIDPNATQAAQKQPSDGQAEDGGVKVAQIIFNPGVGSYDVVSDVGPDFATKRMEASNMMMQLAAQDHGFMGIGGDILMKNLDFPGADQLAQRYARVIPPNITGDGPDPKLEQAMHQASDKILQLQQVIANLSKELKDKDRETDIRAYEAETKRKTGESDVLKNIGNAGPIITAEQVQGIARRTIAEMMMRTPDPDPSAVPEMPQGMMDHLNAGTMQANGPQPTETPAT